MTVTCPLCGATTWDPELSGFLEVGEQEWACPVCGITFHIWVTFRVKESE
jgi:transposase-like protein